MDEPLWPGLSEACDVAYQPGSGLAPGTLLFVVSQGVPVPPRPIPRAKQAPAGSNVGPLSGWKVAWTLPLADLVDHSSNFLGATCLGPAFGGLCLLASWAQRTGRAVPRPVPLRGGRAVVRWSMALCEPPTAGLFLDSAAQLSVVACGAGVQGRKAGDGALDPWRLARRFLDDFLDLLCRVRPPSGALPAGPWDEAWQKGALASSPGVFSLPPSAPSAATLRAWWGRMSAPASDGPHQLALRVGRPNAEGLTSLHLWLLPHGHVALAQPMARVVAESSFLRPAFRLGDTRGALRSAWAGLRAAVPELGAQGGETMVHLVPEQLAAILGNRRAAVEAAGYQLMVPNDLRNSLPTEVLELEESSGVITMRHTPHLRGRALGHSERFALLEGGVLTHLRDGWCIVDDAGRRVLGRAGRTQELLPTEALGLALLGEDPQSEASVELGPQLARRIAQLGAGTSGPRSLQPEGVSVPLRPYQRRGVAWLAARANLGLGACLADEMGLGKTLQWLSLLQTLRLDGVRRPSLVVCPLSVLGNWLREARRFLPGLRVVVHHGSRRASSPERLLENEPELILTTYALLARDVRLFSELSFELVGLDEAQCLKNPASDRARAARELSCRVPIALTGTPLENHPLELWALFDVLLPGLLGSASYFRRRYAAPLLSGDEERAEELRRLTGPFMLRRRKTDEEVKGDLPERHVLHEWVSPTEEQKKLYRETATRLLNRVEDAGGGARRGHVFSLINALKQICNHPRQWLDDAGELFDRSAKLEHLLSTLAIVEQQGEASLIFTQYRTMGELLCEAIGGRFGMPVPFFHGGLSPVQRDELVADFQGGRHPVLVISLRAGGTGLNLTAASHVFHYDRWWNPAVEDQATDRAHRLGQSRDVTVHVLSTLGTIEEQIAELVERKRGLQEQAVVSGEQWLFDLDGEQLEAMVQLREDW